MGESKFGFVCRYGPEQIEIGYFAFAVGRLMTGQFILPQGSTAPFRLTRECLTNRVQLFCKEIQWQP